MNLKNKLFAGLTALSVVAMSFAPAVNFVSVKADSAEDMAAYEWALDSGLTTMTSFNAFMFENAISREQTARFLVKGAEALEIDLSSDQSCDYKDLASADQSLVEFINEGCEMGVFKAQADFNPKDLLTREQAELTVARIVYGMDEVAMYAEDGDITEFAAARELLMADDIVKVELPGQSAVKRGHLLLMLYRLADAEITDPTDPVAPGYAELSLVSSAGTFEAPAVVNGVKVGTIKLTAGQNDTKVSSVVVSREGLGNATDIAGIWLANASVVTDARTVSSSSQSATVRFAPALELKAGSSMTFDVMAAFNGAVNSTHTFKVTSVNVSNGTASGAPVTLGTVKTTSYSVGTVSASTDPKTVNSGKTNQLFTTAKLVPSKEGTVKGFVITRNSGEDLNKVLSNAKAYHNGVEVGSVSVTNDKIIVSGLNIARLAGESANVEIKGDIIYVGPATTVSVQIANSATSVDVVEKASGFGMPLASAPSASTISLSALNLTITKKSTGSQTVAPGTSSVVLYDADITSDAEFEVTKYTLTQNLSGSWTGFNDAKVTLYVDGVDNEIMSNSFVSTSSDRFTVQPGVAVKVKVTANVLSTALPGDYRFTFTINDVKNIADGTTISGLNKSQQGDKVTIKNGTATVKNSTVAAPSTSTVYAGEAQEIGRFAIKSEAEDITLREVKLVQSGSADLTEVIASDDVKLINVATNAEVPATVTVSANEILFEGISQNLVKDTDTNFKVVATTTSFESTIHGQTVALKLNSANVTADKNSGGSATLAGSATMKSYTLGVQPPVVTLTKLDDDKFKVTIKNVDTESDVTLQSITARVRILAADEGYTGSFCLNKEGSSVIDCASADASASVGAVPGSASALTLSTPEILSEDGGSVSFEIFVDSDFINPAVLRAEISALGYNGTTESYNVSAQ